MLDGVFFSTSGPHPKMRLTTLNTVGLWKAVFILFKSSNHESFLEKFEVMACNRNLQGQVPFTIVIRPSLDSVAQLLHNSRSCVRKMFTHESAETCCISAH